MDYTDLNSRQIAILDYVKDYIKKRGYPPSIREICKEVGLKSPSTVQTHLDSLEKRGYIRRDPLKKRTIEILDWDDSPYPTAKEIIEAPILGKISAGNLKLAIEECEDIFPLPLDFVHSNKQVYLLRVDGDSMIDVGIENNDLLIIEEATTARNGEIVVALVGDEATVKTFYREPNRFRLQPENQALTPIYVNEVEIIGKPIGLLRHF